jgi:hypothetical protein
MIAYNAIGGARNMMAFVVALHRIIGVEKGVGLRLDVLHAHLASLKVDQVLV